MDPNEIDSEDYDAYRSLDPDVIEAEAAGLAYRPEDAPSIRASLERIRLHERRSLERGFEIFGPDPSAVTPAPPWRYCDPELRTLDKVLDHEADWQRRFTEQLRPEPDRIDPAAYTALRALYERLLGDASRVVPFGRFHWQRRTFIDSKAFEDICNQSHPEVHEAAFFVLKYGADPSEAVRRAMWGTFGRMAGQPETADDEDVEITTQHLVSNVRSGVWTPDDLPLLTAYWRVDLKWRLLAFGRYLGLSNALRIVEYEDPLLRAVPGGPQPTRGVTQREAQHALTTLAALRRMRSPITRYSEVETFLERAEMAEDLNPDGLTGEGVRKGATRALRALGLDPTPETLLRLLTENAEGLRAVARDRSAGPPV